MGKKRVYKLARELNMTSKQLITKANAKGFPIKNHMSTLDHAQEMKVRRALTGAKHQSSRKPNSAAKKRKRRGRSKSPRQKRSTNRSRQNQQDKPHQNNSRRARRRSQKKRNLKSNRGSRSSRRRQAHLRNQAHQVHRGHQSSHKPNGNQSKNNNHRQSNRRSNHSNRRSKFIRRPKTYSNRRKNSQNNSNGHRHNNKRRRRNRRRRNRFNRYTTNQRIRQIHKRKRRPRRKSRPLPKTLYYTNGMNAQDIGKILHRAPAEIVKKLIDLGIMVNQNKSLNRDTIELLAADYHIHAQEKKRVDVSDIDKMFKKEEKNTKHLVSRPPVITIMGHVDHGKTTLLDYLRHSHVAAGEAGGITQDIGAYQIHRKGKTITFLDTPGHAAFSAMRARGAEMTDLIVLVVAADDGVMPQTVEAIHHARAAKTPIIVAINKIDKPGANPKKVTNQLSRYNLIPEKWGGDTIFVNISAKYGTNVNELLDMIILKAEVMELKANPKQNAAGSVVESRLDQGRGPVATVLVQQGTMHVEDPVVVGDTFGRIRTMTNENHQQVKVATPSTPVEITGLNSVPEAGDRFVVFNSEKAAREAGEKRAEQAQMERRKQNNTVTLDNLFDTMKKKDMKKVDLIVKADVQGSVEAIDSSLRKIKVKGVRISIVHSGVGAINESDVTLAQASNAIILGFNVRPTPQAKIQAENYKVDVRMYDVIYDLIDEVKSAMKGMLAPKYKEVTTGDVDVRQLYKASAVGTIAGGMVTKGYIKAGSRIHLVRDEKVIYTGKLGSLKRFKDDAKEIKEGFECGLTIADYNDIKVGDTIEAYAMKAVPRK